MDARESMNLTFGSSVRDRFWAEIRECRSEVKFIVGCWLDWICNGNVRVLVSLTQVCTVAYYIGDTTITTICTIFDSEYKLLKKKN